MSNIGSQQRDYERCRQVHLDFHTSEHMPAVGSRFDKKNWQEALRLGRVNLINIFGKCHHSWCYYPTKVGRMHPTLSHDLLGAQIEACHEIDVKVSTYITVGWSANDALEHPEWIHRNADGSICGYDPAKVKMDDPKPIVNWSLLCPVGPYHHQVMAHVEEVCRMYPTDGIWLDIYSMTHACYCDACRAGMAAAGVDASNEAAAMTWRIGALLEHQGKVAALVEQLRPGATIYFNGTTPTSMNGLYKHAIYRHNSKNDLEDLPTTWGGYNKFPLRARLFHNVGRPVVAMSGKFHTMWGEFGGFKHRDAMKYEAACMIANGARCNFGDQMHPDGHMDLSTYANIGHAFEYIEKIEPYGVPGVPVSNLALLHSENGEVDEGAASMLLETQTEFEMLRPGAKIDERIDVLVIPGSPCMDDVAAAIVNAFLARGGKVLAMGAGALDASRSKCLLDVGAEYQGAAAYANDYTQAAAAVGEDLPETPFLNYEAALRFAPAAGTQVLAAIYEPYFDRTYAKYCSHQNTPNRTEPAAHPAAFRKGNVIVTAHDLGTMYHRHGARVHRQLFLNCLKALYTQPMLETTMPSAGRATLIHQPCDNRYVAHLTYATPMKRGRCEIIEDIVPLTNIPLTVRLPKKIKRVYAIPSMQPLAATPAGEAISLTIPRFECHTAVVFEY
ncbi:MAG: hypothetical protein ABFD92_05535 [Planctomycetaceae bacterium]|nr:hypothetical protein [Planctomycetaceae bacterium]